MAVRSHIAEGEINDTPIRTPAFDERTNLDRARPLDLISELMGQSSRKNIGRLILGSVLPGPEWTRCDKDNQASR